MRLTKQQATNKQSSKRASKQISKQATPQQLDLSTNYARQEHRIDEKHFGTNSSMLHNRPN
jgi:hypothetical protein